MVNIPSVKLALGPANFQQDINPIFHGPGHMKLAFLKSCVLCQVSWEESYALKPPPTQHILFRKHYKTYLSVQILHCTGHAAKKGSSSRNMYSVTREKEGRDLLPRPRMYATWIAQLNVTWDDMEKMAWRDRVKQQKKERCKSVYVRAFTRWTYELVPFLDTSTHNKKSYNLKV